MYDNPHSFEAFACGQIHVARILRTLLVNQFRMWIENCLKQWNAVEAHSFIRVSLEKKKESENMFWIKILESAETVRCGVKNPIRYRRLSTRLREGEWTFPSIRRSLACALEKPFLSTLENSTTLEVYLAGAQHMSANNFFAFFLLW